MTNICILGIYRGVQSDSLSIKIGHFCFDWTRLDTNILDWTFGRIGQKFSCLSETLCNRFRVSEGLLYE